jgi:hypothetical protein
MAGDLSMNRQDPWASRHRQGRAPSLLAPDLSEEVPIVKQQVRTVLIDDHKITWVAQALTDDDGNVVLEEHLHFRIDGRTVSDSDGVALLTRLGYVNQE